MNFISTFWGLKCYLTNTKQYENGIGVIMAKAKGKWQMAKGTLCILLPNFMIPKETNVEYRSTKGGIILLLNVKKPRKFPDRAVERKTVPAFFWTIALGSVADPNLDLVCDPDLFSGSGRW
jgi:hypothetical protein